MTCKHVYDEYGLCFECSKPKPLTSKDRVKAYRLRQKQLDRLKRELYLTDSEWAAVKVFINELRKSDESS